MPTRRSTSSWARAACPIASSWPTRATRPTSRRATARSALAASASTSSSSRVGRPPRAAQSGHPACRDADRPLPRRRRADPTGLRASAPRQVGGPGRTRSEVSRGHPPRRRAERLGRALRRLAMLSYVDPSRDDDVAALGEGALRPRAGRRPRARPRLGRNRLPNGPRARASLRRAIRRLHARRGPRDGLARRCRRTVGADARRALEPPVAPARASRPLAGTCAGVARPTSASSDSTALR